MYLCTYTFTTDLFPHVLENYYFAGLRHFYVFVCLFVYMFILLF
jgi:hypothetical protein